MCTIFKNILAITLFFLIINDASAKSYSVFENRTDLLIKTENYEIRIPKESFALALLRNGQNLLQTLPTQPLFIDKNGTEYAIGSFVNFDDHTDTLRLNYSTTLKGTHSTFKMVFSGSSFTLELKTNSIYDKIGCNVLLQDGAKWYGGNVTSAQNWPANLTSYEVDPFYSCSNQTSPIWLCSKGVGVFVATHNSMGYSFNKDKAKTFSFHVENTDELKIVFTVGNTITEAHKTMMGIVGKPNTIPPKIYFAQPIFNSWIQFKKDVNQAGLIKYAKEIRKHKVPCGILEVDDMWTPTYGDFEFDVTKFPEPKKMIDSLNDQGFKVALWVTPFVEKKASVYNFLLSKGYLILEPNTHKPLMIDWWDGNASLIDLSNPQAYDWLLQQLKNLQSKYGISGYKFDAGDADFLNRPFLSYGNITPIQYTDLYASLGKFFEINELRVSWLTQPLGLVQRLRDKNSDWSSDKGIGSIIPHGMTEGLIGYSYFCPDMIGGGEMGSFEKNNDKIDHELFVRWTQASTFMPMMQFSFAPWRLDSASMSICKSYAELHEQLGDYIYHLAEESKKGGEPIIRPLFYNYPNDSTTYSVSDQFMLGNKFLVAPVLQKKSVSRNIYLPEGIWVDYWNGNIIKGGQTLVDYSAPIEKLPVFINIL